jgi:hypothetical protein
MAEGQFGTPFDERLQNLKDTVGLASASSDEERAIEVVELFVQEYTGDTLTPDDFMYAATLGAPHRHPFAWHTVQQASRLAPEQLVGIAENNRLRAIGYTAQHHPFTTDVHTSFEFDSRPATVIHGLAYLSLISPEPVEPFPRTVVLFQSQIRQPAYAFGKSPSLPLLKIMQQRQLVVGMDELMSFVDVNNDPTGRQSLESLDRAWQLYEQKVADKTER